MIREAIEKINELAVKAATPHVVKPDAEPAHVYYLRDEKGVLRRQDAEAALRNHKVSDLASLALLAKQYIDGDGGTDSTIWYSRTGVVLIIDDTNRRDRATLPLEPSPQLKALMQLEAAPCQKAQGAMVSFLRISLAGCLGRCPTLVENLRRLKFRKTAEGESSISQGKASIGRALTAEMTGAEIIPEEVVFDVPAFLGHPWRVSVACSLEAIPSNESFQLVPLAGQIEEAFRKAEDKLREQLHQELAEQGVEAVNVYFGVP